MRIISFSPDDIGEQEIDAVAQVMRSGWITTGPKTKQFERQLTHYCGSASTVCVSSNTAAMECTLRILGIGPGDEIITTAYTYTASASVIHHVGATIRLCDVAPDSFMIDYDRLADMINEKTKAIIAVDIGGVMCDYDRIFEIVRSKSALFKPSDNEYQRGFGRPIVIADAAHSIGAQYKGRPSGSVADFSCISFHAVKNVTTAEGGAVTWVSQPFFDDAKLYREYMLQSLHGQSRDALEKDQMVGAWEYDIIEPLYKCNMTDIMAAIGSVQLKRYPEMLAQRRRIIEIYDKAFADEPFIRPVTEGGSAHLYMLRIRGINGARRSEIIEKMAIAGVRCNVHYKPLPMMTAYKNLGFDIDDYPNAYDMFINEISLPVYSKLTLEEAQFVADTMKSIVLC